jgi:ADP-heptose:LPS heptosyltransferase
MAYKMKLRFAELFLRWRQQRWPMRPWSAWRPDLVRRVLLINSTALGDLLFSTPAMRGLRERYPDWQVEVVVQPRLLPLISALPWVSRGWGLATGGVGFWRLARELRRQRYDLVIILHGNDPEATLLAHLTDAPFLIGSGHSPLHWAYSLAVPRQGPSEHAIERRLNLVRPVGAAVAVKHMAVVLPPAVEQRAAALLVAHFGHLPPLLVALHPGGSDPYKRWPSNRFGELAKWLEATYSARLLIIGTAGERGLADEVAVSVRQPVFSTAGRFDILMVAGLLSHCRLLVGNDSGPFHLGLALGVPSLGLLGADAPERVGPYQVAWGQAIFKTEACPRNPCVTRRCVRPLCLEAIQLEEVCRLLRQWWEPQLASQPGQRVSHV